MDTHRCAVTKHEVSADTTCDKGVKVALFPAVELALQDKKHFVDGHEFSQLQCVRLCGRKNAVNPCAPRLVGEECRHDQCVREAHLDSINDTVAGALYHGQEVVVPRAGVG